MKTILFYTTCLALFLSGINSNAQDNPDNLSPTLLIRNENQKAKEILLDELNVHVQVIGNLTTTTFEMRFLNPNDRVMEGELIFPLADGASITRFAMDINGLIREGVPVEKNKGQQVFESIERIKVDPGLLEHVDGNTFKTRVYPIPANGYKSIIIAYDEELHSNDERSIFSLPLFFNRDIRKFSLEVEVLKQKLSPILMESKFENFAFENWDENFKAEANYKNIHLNHQLKFAIPITQNRIGVYTEKGVKTNDTYFYITTAIDQIKHPKEVPTYISIFWDVSASGKERNLNKEINLLKEYLTNMETGKVELFLFSNTIEKTGIYQVSEGKSEQLIQQIENLYYDGATQLSSIDFSLAKGKEILLFSDGMGTYGDNSIQKSNKPLIAINSGSKADHSLLNYLAISSGGRYVNLQKITSEEAMHEITSETLRLISTSYNNSVSDLYPSIPIEVANTFSCSGKIIDNNGIITLNFGYGDEVIETTSIKLNENLSESNGMLEKTWANKKLWELNLLYDRNKEEIKQLGKEFSIVTRNTSLIVLETIGDYVEYKIEPPKELMPEYLRLIKQQDKNEAKTKLNVLDNVARLYQEKIDWWKREYKPAIEPIFYQETSPIEPRDYVSQTKTFSGIVYDDGGLPLAGAIVKLKGVNQGTLTDVEGKFSIEIPENAIMQYSFIGYQTVEQDVSGINSTAVGLPTDISGLDEVVVVGYGVSRQSQPTGSVEILRMEPEASEDVSFFAANDENKLKGEEKNSVGAIYLKPWNPDTPYLKELEKSGREEMYSKYLKIRTEYYDVPSFYADVCNLMYTQGLEKEAVKVLSNLAEIQLSSHELLRVMAHKLEQMKEYEAAIEVYKKVLELRLEEPQSYRDLALVYAKNEQYQEAVDMLWEAVNKSWDDRFPGIEVIMLTEMNSIIVHAGDKINTSHIDSRLLVNLPVNIRVVLNWDADNTDMDLWLTDPRGEKCFYSHKETQIGGLMSNDFTQGYGPEEFMLKKAMEGNYKVEANYFGSSQQKIAGPVTIYLQLYLNFGMPEEELKEIIIRLSDNKEVIEIGEFEFKQRL